MDKKLLAFLCITIILIFGGIVAMVEFYNPGRFVNPAWKSEWVQPYKDISRAEHSPQNEPIKKLIGGIGALLLLGYLFVICYLKFMQDAKAGSMVSENSLHKISLESGRTEYELFVIAAEEWSITEAQIDEDFKIYMAANVLPYYVMDLVRKNKDRINKSLEKDEEIGPTSWWDLVKALLLFPGCFLIPYFLVITLGCSGNYGQIKKQTGTEDQITLAELRENWDDYDIYYGMRSGRYADAIMFDPKNNSTQLRGNSWIKIEDQESLDEKIKDLQSIYDYAKVHIIEGENSQFFGYMYYGGYFQVSVNLVDEQTLYVSSLPKYKSAP